MTDASTVLRELKAALERQDRLKINAACGQLIAMRAPLRGQWRSLIAVLLRNGELTLARGAADCLARETGNSPLGRFEQAATYARSGRLTDAKTILDGLPQDVPDPVANAYIRGTIATNLGDFDAARHHLRRATQLSPASGQAWLALAMAGRVQDLDRSAMEAAVPAMRRAPATERGAFQYALGKAFDEQGRYDAAFAAFSEGAAIIRALRVDETGAAQAASRMAIQGWTAEALQALPKPAGAPTRAILVTGLPRSGTTLVEQILVSHSTVQDGEELGLFPLILQEARGGGTDAILRAAADGSLDQLAKLYAHLLDERFPGTDRVVDKTLQASRFMGLIAAVLPDAPIVWLRREPLDNAWSIFKTYFLADLGWTFDLADIGRQMAAEDRLFDHWSSLRPEQILPVKYSQLTKDPKTVIPRIAAHCGLAVEEQQLRPHENSRAVTTASVAQVRSPIGTHAIGAAEPYRRHLQPFIDAYTSAGGTID